MIFDLFTFDQVLVLVYDSFHYLMYRSETNPKEKNQALFFTYALVIHSVSIVLVFSKFLVHETNSVILTNEYCLICDIHSFKYLRAVTFLY